MKTYFAKITPLLLSVFLIMVFFTIESNAQNTVREKQHELSTLQSRTIELASNNKDDYRKMSAKLQEEIDNSSPNYPGKLIFPPDDIKLIHTWIENHPEEYQPYFNLLTRVSRSFSKRAKNEFLD